MYLRIALLSPRLLVSNLAGDPDLSAPHSRDSLRLLGTEFGEWGCDEAQISEEKRLFTESGEGIQ